MLLQISISMYIYIYTYVCMYIDIYIDMEQLLQCCFSRLPCPRPKLLTSSVNRLLGFCEGSLRSKSVLELGAQRQFFAEAASL